MESDDSGRIVLRTPYDELIPQVSDPAAAFYLDVIRVYLALCEGLISLEEAQRLSAILREDPEYAKHPIDPSLLPVSSALKNRLIENLQTLKRYNLYSVDAIRSAYGFSFMLTDAPMTQQDFSLLRLLADDPLIHVTKAARQLGVTNHIVSQSMRRLRERNGLRFSALVDTTAFGINSFMLFFKTQPDVDWSAVETGLAEFPFTKSILKTTMSNTGYASFLFPGGEERVRQFRRGIARLVGEVFEFATLHSQTGMMRGLNLSLYDLRSWQLPEEFEGLLDLSVPPPSDGLPKVLWCRGPRYTTLQAIDFMIVSQLRVNSRMTTTQIRERLRLMGVDIGPRPLMASLRRVRSPRLMRPFIAFGGVGLSTNFCFEIVCNSQWQKRVLSFVPLLPASLVYVSDKGLVIWMDVPSEHQTWYYRVIRSLQEQDGVDLVQPIMMVSQYGSRSMDDLTRHWRATRDGWYVDPDMLDLSRYVF